jgi:hypothetical protein
LAIGLGVRGNHMAGEEADLLRRRLALGQPAHADLGGAHTQRLVDEILV